jgi:hypothetical protein
MILKLVPRFVEVDLLDRAAALLTHPVRFCLTYEGNIIDCRHPEASLGSKRMEKFIKHLGQNIAETNAHQ